LPIAIGAVKYAIELARTRFCQYCLVYGEA
jgi:hypothetical protein